MDITHIHTGKEGSATYFLWKLPFLPGFCLLPKGTIKSILTDLETPQPDVSAALINTIQNIIGTQLQSISPTDEMSYLHRPTHARTSMFTLLPSGK